MKKSFLRILLIICMVLFCFSAVAENDEGGDTELSDGYWTYTVTDTEATITGYTGEESSIQIPDHVGAEGDNAGYSVTTIASGALSNVTAGTEISIGVELPLQIIEDGAIRDQTVLHISNPEIDLRYHTGSEGEHDTLALLQWHDNPDEPSQLVLPETFYGLSLTGIEDDAVYDSAVIIPGNGLADLIYHEATENDTAYLTIREWRGGDIAVDLMNGYFGLSIREFEEGATISFANGAAEAIYHAETEEKTAYLTLSSWSGTGENATVPSTYAGIPILEIGENAFSGSFGEIILSEGIEKIGAGGFEGVQGGENPPSLVLPSSSLKLIGDRAFAGSAFTTFTIPDSVTTIGEYAYSGSRIQEMTIPASVTEMGKGIFAGSQLEEVTILAPITRLPDEMFATCANLSAMNLPTTLTEIGRRSIYCCYALTELTLPEGILTIDEEGLYNCTALVTVNLPATLTSIGQLALSDCSNLTTVNFNGAEVSIGKQAFDQDVKLTNIQNAENITSIDELGFGNLRELTAFTFGEKITSVGSKSFGGCWKLESLSFNGTQKITIGNNAFESCLKLESVSIPNADLGESVFTGCTALREFTLESGSIRGNTLLGSYVISSTLGEGITAIPDGVFSGLTRLSKVEILGSMNVIPASAFSGCVALSDVTLPSTVSMIRENAFLSCTALTYLDLPASLTTIESHAFSNSGLKAVILPDNVTTIGSYAFSGSRLKAVILPDGLPSIGERAFYNCQLRGVLRADDTRASQIFNGQGEERIYNEDGLNNLNGEVTLPTGLGSIGQRAFTGNSNLTRATMPSSDIILEQQAFDSTVHIYTAEPECEWIYTIHGNNCTIIGYLGHTENLTVPADLNGLHVTVFGDRVFKDMAFLQTIVLPDDTGSIGEQLFYNCRNLRTASLGKKLITVPTQTFFACTALTQVNYPNNTLKQIEDYAFYNCVALTDANIPEGVTYLGNGAFGGCGNMTAARLPQSLTSMGSGVFADCKSLTEIAIPNGVLSLDAYMSPGDPGCFSGCAALTTVTIGEGLTNLSSNTFAGLVNLQTVTINATNINIESSAFSGCVALQEVTIQNAYVGDYAFDNCSGMKRFTLMNGSFGYNPFNGCNALTTVSLGSGVDSLTGSIFSGMNRLENVTMAGNITYIPYDAFNGCTRLKTIDLPETVTTIDSNAFAGCGLTQIDLPRDLTAIEYYAFAGCASLQQVVWNNGLSRISDSVFQGCGFIELTLPASVTEIGTYAFAGCNTLVSIHLPNNISSIGADAFPAATRIYCNPSSITARTLSRAGGSFVVEGEDMEFGIRLLMRGNISLGLSIERIWTEQIEITVPSTIGGELVTELGSGLFTSCPSVQKVTFPTSVPMIPADLCAGNNSLKEVTIPEGVTIISARAFQNCTNLHDVNLPSTVVSIGKSAFDGCALLTEITLSDNIQEIGANAFTSTRVYCSLGSKTAEMLSQTGGGFICREYPRLRLRYLFVDGLPGDLEVVGAVAEAVTITIPDSVTSIADGAFESNTTLTAVNLPETLTRIGSRAFAGSGITSIILPEGITEIWNNTFENTLNLRTVTILGAVTSVGESAFAGSGVTGLSFPDGLINVGNYAFRESGLESCVMPASVTSIGYSAFENCVRLVHFDVPAGIRRIENYTFHNTPELKTVNVPMGVENVGYEAFRDSGLASITLPETVKTIESYAFYDCRNLKKVTMAGDMISIGDSAFRNCTLMNELTMSGTLQSMGSSAFYGCKALKDVTLPRNLVSVPYSAFSECDQLIHVKISDGTVNINNYAFSGCDHLVSVELPVGLKGIGECAFQSCALTSLTIPNSVTTIGSYAFNSNRLTSLIIPDSVVNLGAGAFNYNYSMASLRLPTRLATITDNAFYQSGLTNITIPNGTRALGYECFAQSSNLTAALIPASVESIDDTAFRYCGYPFTVYCYHDTVAENFAIRNNYNIIYLDGENPLAGITISPTVTEMTIGVDETVENIRQYFTIQPEDIPYEYTMQFSTTPEETAILTTYEDENNADNVITDLTGLQPGTAVVTAFLAENPDIQASITVYVRANISAITLPDEIWQKKDEALVLTPISTEPAGVTEGFSWSINRDVGYIEGNTLYPTAYGDATITVTAWNGVSASVPLHVYNDPTEVMIKSVPVGLDIGMEATLAPQVRAGYLCTGQLAQHFITWSSRHEGIATVDDTGKVTAISYGTATICATTENGVVGTADIYVSPPITRFNLEGRVLLPVGGSVVLTATDIEPANANPGAFSWTTSPSGLVSYENGIVKVLTDQECNVTITATPWAGAEPKTTDVSIYRPAVESIRIDPVNEWNWVSEYAEIQLTAHVQTTTDEFINQLITWTVDSDYDSDYVDAKGILHVGYGGWGRYLNVTATADNGQSDTLYLGVYYPTNDFILPERIALQTGETITVYPENEHRYSSEFHLSVGTPALAEVSGMSITGKKPGETALTVTSWDGVTHQTQLLVYDPIEEVQIRDLDSNQNKFSVSDSQHDLFVQWDYQAHADAISDKTYRDDLITWSSSDPSIVRVENVVTGAFRTVGYGTATLTATAKSGAKASTVLNIRKEVRTFTLAPITGYVRADVPLTAASIDYEDSYDGFVWTVDPASIGTIEGQTLHVEAAQPINGVLTAISWDGYRIRSTDLTILREPVTAIAIDAYENGEIGVGGSYQMVAHVTAGIDYVNELITWSSSDEQVATVNDRGIVTCIGSGEVTITATADDGTGITDSITLTGVQGVTDFDILPGEITVYTGENAEVTVNNIQPANAVVREFTWTVSPENAAVIQDGVLTPTTASNTEAILTITSWNGVEKSIPVHIIRAEVSSIIISEVSETYVGTPVQLTARVTVNGAEYENRFIRWESSNPEIAEVDENGLVTPKAIGEVWIYAYDKVNEMNSSSIYLYPQVALEDYRVYPDREYWNLAYAHENPIYIYATDFTPWEANNRVTYTAQTAEGQLLEVWENGDNSCYFYYQGPETTITITGTSANGLERTTSVDVRYNVYSLYADTAWMEERPQTIVVGGNTDIVVQVSADNWNDSYFDNMKLSYTSSDEDVATVDSTGHVTGIGKGIADITVTHVYSGISYTVPIRVRTPITSFDLPEEILVPVGGSVEVPISNISPQTAETDELTWESSSAEGIVEVMDGFLYAYTDEESECVLTATSLNGITRSVRVIVYHNVTALYTDGEYLDEEFVPGIQTVYTGKSITLPIYVTTDNGWDDEWFDSLNLVYTSEDEGIATVDGSGNVTGVNKGKTQITVLHLYTGCSVTIPVQVKQPITSFDLPGQVKIPVSGSIDLPVHNILPEIASADELTWSISPEGIAKVENGKLIALTAEETRGTITAVSVNGIERTAQLVIYEPWVDKIELEEVGTVMVGDEIQIIAHVTAGEDEFINAGVKFKAFADKYDDGTYGWEYGANIDENTGMFRAWSPDYSPYYVVATSELSGASDVIEVHVKTGYEDFQVKTPLLLTPGGNNARIQIIGYTPLNPNYNYNPDNNGHLFYETDETNLFRLDNYWVYSNYDGNTGVGTVRVRSVNGVEREVQVVVYSEDEIDSVTITGVPAYAGTYQNIPLTANLSMYGTTVQTTNELLTWNSDNPKVASVNSAGVVRTLGYGIAHITATTVNGRTDTVTIVVSKEPDNFRLPERFTVEYGNSIELQIADVEPEDAAIDITWSVEPAEVASIEGNTLTALAKENTTATITATNWDGSTRTAILEITYTPPLTTLYLPSMLKEIEEEAFMGITAQAVIIPDGCTKIGSRAFADCPNLVYVYIPASVTSIAEDAFAGSGQVEIDYEMNE